MNPVEPQSKSISIGKLVVSLVLGWYFLSYASGDPSRSLANWNLIDNVDLVIHEAGHFIFMFFGEFIHVLGGSFLQVALPIAFAGYFFLRRQYFSASVVLFWVGQNIVNVGTYLGDAVVQQLPLLGGDGTMHDWSYLLLRMDLIGHTDSIAGFLRGTGITVILAAIASCIIFSLSETRRRALLCFFRK